MGSQHMTVHVKDLSESGDTITTLKLNPNNKIKHVKEQIEANTGIGKATQCLLHRFHNGKEEQLWYTHWKGVRHKAWANGVREAWAAWHQRKKKSWASKATCRCDATCRCAGAQRVEHTVSSTGTLTELR